MRSSMIDALENPHVTPEVLTTAQVAQVMRVHPETIRRLIRTGQLKAIKWHQQGTYRVLRSELNRFLNDGASA